MSSTSEAKGRIVKALSGYYYVLPHDAESPEQTVQCRARGVFKKRGLTPLVGDDVLYTLTENGEGTVEALLPRSSELIRPPVANVDLAILVFSVTEPTLNLQLLDKFLVHIEHSGIEAVLCLSKQDLEQDGEETKAAIAAAEAVNRIYTAIGYEVYGTSSRRGVGVEELHDRLKGHVAVFAGQSGVGKSSLLNALVPGLKLETNEISNRLGRGKHTTRHVELVEIGGGYVADTPGFSQLDFTELGIEDLGYCFREMRELAPDCKFRACTHVHEPGCAVLKAVEEGAVAPSRHQNYLTFMTEMKERKRRY
ncbi:MULTISPECIES: ribosome small subunit-dependent GTPase A [unclassified Paenibacillus]|uniref:ribosome small subunit-dependent GTPase A n=1 Tax=unclassified Paenibacillus TaxID=185978 RepID=UPI0010504229|nr:MULTISPECIES: ribosome small subunit-dependent GTPase A [unclassified Paenibacillus]NIK68587.1 ribosome biogenesis GTPase [Paenibacillus sp. BK720]TCM99125.1 ribosome biogenesis GTPase [Paenibacillus sp. BK033]